MKNLFRIVLFSLFTTGIFFACSPKATNVVQDAKTQGKEEVTDTAPNDIAEEVMEFEDQEIDVEVAPPPPPPQELIPVDPDIRTGKLANGIKYIIRKKR